MEPAQFFSSSRMVVVAGKGGVGKTTVAATVALAAARSGLDVVLVEIEGKRGLAGVFGADRLGYEATEMVAARPRRRHGAVVARSVSADQALVDYLADHGLARFGKTLNRMQVLDTLATSTPGLKDLIVLGKIKQIERSPGADLVIVDAPASGHAVSFLRSASGLAATVATGPIRHQADEAVAMLTDPGRCQVMLVTLPEETPVNELVETAYLLEDEVGVKLAPIVVNSVDRHRTLPAGSALVAAERAGVSIAPARAAELDGAARFWRRRRRLHEEQLARLDAELPLEQIVLPHCLTPRVGPPELESLAAAFLEGVRRVHGVGVAAS